MRFGLLLALLLLAPGVARAGELIRYVTSSGEMGLTNDPKEVPAGATILSRRPQGGGPLPRAVPGGEAPTAADATAPAPAPSAAPEADEAPLGTPEPASSAAVPADAPQPSGGSFQVLPSAPPARPPTPPTPAGAAVQPGPGAPQDAIEHPPAGDPAADDELFERGTTVHEKALHAPDPDDPGAEAWWHARRREAEDQVAKAAFALNRAEAVHRACQTRANAAFKSDVEILSDSPCTSEALVQARQRYDDAKEYLEDGLFDDCRRAACLPGWIRSSD